MTNPIIIQELTRIAEENNGILDPEKVVTAARSKNSPLHSLFEWDERKAAARYRLDQARQLIRVCVQYVGPQESPVLSRVFVSLTTDRREGGYRQMISVLADDAMRAQMLKDAIEDMARFRKKYADLKELVEVLAAMDSVAA